MVSLMIGMALVLIIDSQDFDGLADLLHLGQVDVVFFFIWGAVCGAPPPLVGEDM